MPRLKGFSHWPAYGIQSFLEKKKTTVPRSNVTCLKGFSHWPLYGLQIIPGEPSLPYGYRSLLETAVPGFNASPERLQ